MSSKVPPGGAGAASTAYPGRPHCYNKTGPSNYLVQDGWEPGYTASGQLTRFPRMVEIENPMSSGCKSWESHGSSPPVPLVEGWKCDGCAHEPVATRAKWLQSQRGIDAVPNDKL